MPANDVVRSVEWALLIAQQPARDCLPAGILLVDRVSDELHLRLRPELPEAQDETAEFWRELPNDLVERSRELGGSRMLDWLETTASHLVQLGSRTYMESTNPQETLDLLYRRYITGDLEAQGSAEREFRRGAGR
jgi:hypothetical protein